MIGTMHKIRRIISPAFAGVVFLFCAASSLWAGGRKAQIETATAEGGEIWQHNFDVTARKKGTYNIIVNAKDHAGNLNQSGPFNLKVDPNSGLPVARVVYPLDGAVLRQDINLMGVASGRYGIAQIMVRLDDGEYTPAQGTDYWSRIIATKNLVEGRHTVYAQAVDKKGISGPETSVSFIIDRGPPLIELTSHKTGDIIHGSLTVQGRADDPNGILSIAYSDDNGENYKPLSFKTRRGETEVTFSFPVKTTSREDGPVVFYVRAVDKTGYAQVKPYLFFVDNKGPALEIYTPAAGEDVFGTFLLSGRIQDAVGLSRFYYEWGGSRTDISLRPGDPFWSVNLTMTPGAKNTGSIKVIAEDKSGNVTAVTRKLEDRRKEKVPSVVIDYPPASQLGALGLDGFIYGHIAPGFAPEGVTLEGFGDIEASSGFRISPDQIPQGRTSLRVIPHGDGLTGTPVILRINKPVPVMAKDGTMPRTEFEPSPVTVSAPAPYTWIASPVFTLTGTVSVDQSPQLEYRLQPDEGWRPLSYDSTGAFRAEISAVQLNEGPVHLELRTIRYGLEDLPVYHPLNRAASMPEITFIAPAIEAGAINGNVTVLGSVKSTVPIQEIAYSLDGQDYQPLTVVSRYGRAWFTYFCDFTALNAKNQRLAVRVTDVSGGVFGKTPEFTYDAAADIPKLILNTPAEGEVITGNFDISGIAFDDDAVAAVNYRILGPKAESIPPGDTGEAARAAAQAFADSPPPEFIRIETAQSFQMPVDFNSLFDGEYSIEIYTEDIYGVKSPVLARTVKVSTSAPEAQVVEPVISVYNHGSIIISGNAQDANGIASVSFSMDNGNTFQRAVLSANEAGAREVWQLALNTASYKDGVYSALIRVEDNYGVASFTSAMINIDNTPPELNLSSPENNARIGNELEIMGRVQDNITLKSLALQIISTANANNKEEYELPAEMVIMKKVDLTALPQGEYIIRIAALDLADNESVVSRKFLYAIDDTGSEVSIYNPMPGETHSGPLSVSGTVTGAVVPQQITLSLNDKTSLFVEVDRYGVFRYDIPEETLAADGTLVIAASYETPAGMKIESPAHSVYYSPYGPTLAVDSHKDGDVITGRPYLSGRAWIALPEPGEDEPPLSRKERAQYAVKQVLVSFDNGRSFSRASGGEKWKFRLETGDLPLGPLPVLVKAEFADGRNTVRRLLLTVDTNPPQVATLSPPEDSTHRDDILVYGTAGDDFELDSVEVSLRPGDKAGYSVPQFIQGLYLDAHALGATYADAGLGLSFFKDNVRLQVQFGIAPEQFDGETGRIVGYAIGGKIIANVFYLPFDYYFGPDWSFYSMSFSLGANFTYFTMDKDREAMLMGAIIGQWTFANLDMSKIYPNWKIFKNFAFYLEPELWFISSDVDAETVFRATVGLRTNIF
jgi:hypothetical protein